MASRSSSFASGTKHLYGILGRCATSIAQKTRTCIARNCQGNRQLECDEMEHQVRNLVMDTHRNEHEKGEARHLHHELCESRGKMEFCERSHREVALAAVRVWIEEQHVTSTNQHFADLQWRAQSFLTLFHKEAKTAFQEGGTISNIRSGPRVVPFASGTLFSPRGK